MNNENKNWGGVREGAGRPIVGVEKRNKNLCIRLSESELTMIKEKAENAGMKVTEFIMELVRKA